MSATCAGQSDLRAVLAPVRASQQRRLLFEEAAKTGSLPYRPANLIRAIRFRRPIDRPLLRRTLLALATRHSQLRSRFEPSERWTRAGLGRVSRRQVADRLFDVGLYTQAVTESADVAIVERRVQHLPDHYDPGFCQRVKQELRQPFRYDRPPLIRAALWSAPDGTGVLTCVVPHLVADGLSMDIIAQEATSLYSAGEARLAHDLPPLNTEYHDWVHDEWSAIAADRYAEALTYWREQWRTWQPHFLTADDLGLHRRARSRPADRPAVSSLTIAPHLTSALREFAVRERTTPHVVWRTALYIGLGRIARKDAVAGWCNYANRTPSTANVVGWFANRHIIGVECSGRRSARDVLKDVHRAVMDLGRFGACPLNALWNHLGRNLEFEPGRFDIAIDFRVRRPARVDGLDTLSLLNMRPQVVDLDVRIIQEGDRFRVDAGCAAEYAGESFLAHWLASSHRCLEETIDRPNARIDSYRW